MAHTSGLPYSHGPLHSTVVSLVCMYKGLSTLATIVAAAIVAVLVAENGDYSHRNYSQNSITSSCCGFVVQ